MFCNEVMLLDQKDAITADDVACFPGITDPITSLEIVMQPYFL